MVQIDFFHHSEQLFWMQYNFLARITYFSEDPFNTCIDLSLKLGNVSTKHNQSVELAKARQSVERQNMVAIRAISHLCSLSEADPSIKADT